MYPSAGDCSTNARNDTVTQRHKRRQSVCPVGFTFELNIAATGSLLSTRAGAVPVFPYFDSTKGTTLPAASADCGRRKPT